MPNTLINLTTPNTSTAKIIAFPTPEDTKYTIETGNEPVQPLKSIEDVQRAKNYFLNKPERYRGQNIRDYTIFVCGINCARRCGDLLHLRFHNILNEDYSIKSHFLIREQKTGKSAKVIISPAMADALRIYITNITMSNETIDLSDYVFTSRKKDRYGNPRPLDVRSFYRKMQALRKELEIADPIGTHTLRKTWAYFALKNNSDNSYAMNGVSKALGHNNLETTFHYAGIGQEEIDDLFMNNQL